MREHYDDDKSMLDKMVRETTQKMLESLENRFRPGKSFWRLSEAEDNAVCGHYYHNCFDEVLDVYVYHTSDGKAKATVFTSNKKHEPTYSEEPLENADRAVFNALVDFTSTNR